MIGTPTDKSNPAGLWNFPSEDITKMTSKRVVCSGVPFAMWPTKKNAFTGAGKPADSPKIDYLKKTHQGSKDHKDAKVSKQRKMSVATARVMDKLGKICD